MKAKKTCPICGKIAAEKYSPFCSRRCADLDLKRWLGGEYRIPTDEVPEGGYPAPDDVQDD